MLKAHDKATAPARIDILRAAADLLEALANGLVAGSWRDANQPIGSAHV
jgi:acyl-CoA reductase-like NAD-dependent aldehyde dehydrogenase